MAAFAAIVVSSPSTERRRRRRDTARFQRDAVVSFSQPKRSSLRRSQRLARPLIFRRKPRETSVEDTVETHRAETAARGKLRAGISPALSREISRVGASRAPTPAGIPEMFFYQAGLYTFSPIIFSALRFRFIRLRPRETWRDIPRFSFTAENRRLNGGIDSNFAGGNGKCRLLDWLLIHIYAMRANN